MRLRPQLVRGGHRRFRCTDIREQHTAILEIFLGQAVAGAAGTAATGEVTPTVLSSSSGACPAAEDAKCSRYHGADARPIFDSYPLWPGYYGSVQDTFPYDRIGQKQANNYAAFSAGAAKAGVYEDLIYPAGSPVAPFLDPRLFHDNTVTLDPKLFHYMHKARCPRLAWASP